MSETVTVELTLYELNQVIYALRNRADHMRHLAKRNRGELSRSRSKDIAAKCVALKDRMEAAGAPLVAAATVAAPKP